MKTLKTWLEAKEITLEDFNKKDAEAQAEIFNEMNEANAVSFKELQDNVESTKEDIATAQKELKNVRDEQFKSLNEKLIEMGIAVKKLKEGEKSSVTTNTIQKSLTENLDTLKEMSKGQKGSFSFKVVGDMSLAGNVTGQVPQAERIPGLNTIASRQVRLLDIVSAGSISSNLVEWVYQANKDGTAGTTSETSAKNQIDFDLVVGSQKVEKVTAYIKATTEMLSDISWIETEIRNELTREVLKSVEDNAYDGNGISPNLNGYRTVSTTFTGGSAAYTVTLANEVDVLAAAVLQIEEADQPMPNYHMVHPATLYAIKSLKVGTSDERYVEYNNRITIENDGSVRLDGVRIMSTTLVTAGEYLTGFFDYAKLLNKDGLSITIGLDSDDFTKNFRTILAEWRGVSFIKNNDRTAFVKGVFATDKVIMTAT